MRYNILVGGIHIESSTFTPYLSGKSDFTIFRGEDFLRLYPWLENYQEEVNLIPLTRARALPGGVVSREFYRQWWEEFSALLHAEMKKHRIDGFLLDIHGAMSVEGSMDAEGELASDIRKILGKEIPISCSMDLHGNVSDALFEACDLLTCYRTAPHIDIQETRERAFSNLWKLLKNPKQRIFRAKVDVPILLPGEKTSTEVEPAKSLYAEIPQLTADSAIWDAAIWMGFPWADQPRSHGYVVVCGSEKEKVDKACHHLAQRFWMSRQDFCFVGPTAPLEEAIDMALSSKQAPFFISDTGDNPGAGGAGDMNLVLRAFLQRNDKETIAKKVLFASIYDKECIDFIYQKRVGERLLLAPGGKIDPSFGAIADLEVTVDCLFENPIAGRSAMVHLDHLFIIITENRFQYGSWEYFQRSGLKSFADFDIIVVKMGYLEPDLSSAAAGWVMALTPGAVNQDLLRIPYQHRKKPLFPFEDDFEADLTVLSHSTCLL